MDKLELKVLKYIYKFRDKGIFLADIQKHFKKINSDTIRVIVSDLYSSGHIFSNEKNDDFFVEVTYLGCHVIENNKLTKREKILMLFVNLLFTVVGGILGFLAKYLFDLRFK